MTAFATMLGTMAMFTVLLVPGYILGKLNLIYASAAECICNILMYVAMPSLVFSKLLAIDFGQIGVGFSALSTVIPVVLVGTLWLFCKLLRPAEPARRRTMTFCALFPNCGFLGIPLAGALWPDKPQIVLYISIFNVVSTFLLLTFGVFVLTGDKNEIRLKKTLVSPIFFAIVLGVAGSVLSVAARFPRVLEYAETLSSLTTPLSMTFLGYELSKQNLFAMWKNRGVFAVSLIKLILSPLVVLSVLLILRTLGFELETDFVYAMMVSSAVSTAASAPSMVEKYKSDSEYAATLTLSGTLLCVITLPAIYSLYNLFFGI